MVASLASRIIIPLALVPSTASQSAAHRSNYQLLQTPVRVAGQQRAIERDLVPDGRAWAAGRGANGVDYGPGGAVLSLEREDALLAGLHRAAPREPLPASSGRRAQLQLLRPAHLGHALRHVSKSAPVASALRIRREGIFGLDNDARSRCQRRRHGRRLSSIIRRRAFDINRATQHWDAGTVPRA